MPDTDDWQQFTGLTGGALAAAFAVGIAVFVVMLIAYTNVISRAGYSRWWILIMVVPVVNIVMLLIFCFKEWPAQRELRELREFKLRAQTPYGQPGGFGPGGFGPGGYGQPGAYGQPGSYPQQ